MLIEGSLEIGGFPVTPFLFDNCSFCFEQFTATLGVAGVPDQIFADMQEEGFPVTVPGLTETVTIRVQRVGDYFLVPEPSTALLLASGLVAMAAGLRRRAL